ncbi:AB-hydrolase lipase domain-containing protein [Cynara cardunculus var. scolymus]|uniref:AB-hydrolase lipase domain-containing protein n=1 Tax=Cynara cardunculus var. scolymus TaxID=59895 RepID=A0A118K0Z6_CYNCS|nr:AB-hydrolase lipase domain-containing protein [Cynara cardunculus var. scolymus]
MGYTIIFTIIVVFYFISISKAVRNVNSIDGQDDLSSTSVNQVGICSLLVETEGYMCEEHKVTTKDGYILSMQRIPMERGGKKADKPPVLLQHGVLMDGGTWVLNTPDESLGFILADNGFDVWIANTRGTNFSRGHTSLSPSDPGTLIAFSAFSKDQTLNMLRSAVLLSPIAYLGQMSSTLARAGADAFLGEALYWLGLHEFAPRGKAVVDLLSVICKMPDNDCSDLMTSFTVIRTGTITMYDYGNADDNQKHYGQLTPPVYDMGSIPKDFPMYLSHGGRDKLSDVEDVKTLLKNVNDHDPDKLVVQYKEDYAHADFVFAVNAKEVIYDPVMAFFKLHY